MKNQNVLLLALCVALIPALRGQMLLVDRAPADSGAHARIGSARTSAGFLGDHFQLGVAGQVWIIDGIRTWAVRDPNTGPTAALGDLYEKVILYGGIEALPPKPGQPPEPECDCHNLMAIKTVTLQPGADMDKPGIWQLDFKEVRWSVPGGQQIQFGTRAIPREGRAGGKVPVWYVKPLAGGEHQLKLFDANGKLLGPYDGDGDALDPATGIGVQVWGHLMANLVIHQSGANIVAVLKGTGSFDVRKTDLASLRFGPKGAVPVSNKLVGAGAQTDLELRFRTADTGIQSSNLTACLNGKQQSGTLFEACDAVIAPRTAK